MTFRQRFVLLMATCAVALLGLSALSVVQAARDIHQGRVGQLTAAVQSAHQVVMGYQALAAAGKMPAAQAQAAAAEAVRLARYGGPDGKADYFYIWASNGTGVMHPIKPEWQGQDMRGKVQDGRGGDVVRMVIEGALKSPADGAYVDTFFPRPGSTEPVAKLQYVKLVPGWNWVVGSGLYMDDVRAEVHQSLLRFGAMLAGVLLVLGGLAWRVSGSLLRQIGGEPADAQRVLAQVAEGDLAVQVPPAVPGSLLDGLGRVVQMMQTTVSQVRGATDSIGVAAGEIASGNADLSGRTEQTASNLEKTASAMEELTGTVRQSAEAARTANQLANSAAQVAQRGGDVVSQVVQTMGEINQSSQRIADIIGVIDGIAFQTNILALNAAVEAARAGEQGRGFAVVAGEVRSLAQRSAEAAKEIKGLIGTSVDKVASGTRLVGDAGQTMTEIVSSVQRVSDIVGEISAAASEQSQGIGEVNAAVAQLDQMTQQNAALVEQSTAAAESLREQVQRLAGALTQYRGAAAAAAVTPVGPGMAASRPAGGASAPLTSKAAPGATHRPAAAQRAAEGSGKGSGKGAARGAVSPAPVGVPTPASSSGPEAVGAAGDGDWTSF